MSEARRVQMNPSRPRDLCHHTSLRRGGGEKKKKKTPSDGDGDRVEALKPPTSHTMSGQVNAQGQESADESIMTSRSSSPHKRKKKKKTPSESGGASLKALKPLVLTSRSVPPSPSESIHPSHSSHGKAVVIQTSHLPAGDYILKYSINNHDAQLDSYLEPDDSTSEEEDSATLSNISPGRTPVQSPKLSTASVSTSRSSLISGPSAERIGDSPSEPRRRRRKRKRKRQSVNTEASVG